MKDSLTKVIWVIIIAALVFADTVFCMKEGLYNIFCSKPSVNVYVSDITDSTKENKVDVVGLKKELEDALSARKSISFKVVKDKKDADIIVDCNVTRYYWSASDPVDMLLGTGAIIYDTVTVENYAYMEAVFTVTDAKKNKTLWQEKLKIDLTKKKMTQQESVPLINKKVAKIFLRDCFGKKASKRQ